MFSFWLSWGLNETNLDLLGWACCTQHFIIKHLQSTHFFNLHKNKTLSRKTPVLKTLFNNMQNSNRLPHGTVRQHEVIRRWDVQILGLLLPLPFTILLIDALNCPGNQVLENMLSSHCIFLLNTLLSLLYFTCMDIQVLHYPLRCPGYLCGLVPGNPSRAGQYSAGESRPTWGPSAWAWPSSADWWDWLQETSPRPQTSSHSAYGTSWP